MFDVPSPAMGGGDFSLLYSQPYSADGGGADGLTAEERAAARRQRPVAMVHDPPSLVVTSRPTTLAASTVTAAGGPSCRAPLLPDFLRNDPHKLRRPVTLDTPVAVFATNLSERSAAQLASADPSAFFRQQRATLDPATGKVATAANSGTNTFGGSSSVWGNAPNTYTTDARGDAAAATADAIHSSGVTSPSAVRKAANSARAAALLSRTASSAPSSATPIKTDLLVGSGGAIMFPSSPRQNQHTSTHHRRAASFVSSRMLHDPSFNKHSFIAPGPPGAGPAVAVAAFGGGSASGVQQQTNTTNGQNQRRFLSDLSSTTAMASASAAASSSTMVMADAVRRMEAITKARGEALATRGNGGGVHHSPSPPPPPPSTKVNNTFSGGGGGGDVLSPIERYRLENDAMFRASDERRGLRPPSEALLPHTPTPPPPPTAGEGSRTPPFSTNALAVTEGALLLSSSAPQPSDPHSFMRLLPRILDYLTPDELSCVAVFVCKGWYRAIVGSIRLQVRRKLFEPSAFYSLSVGSVDSSVSSGPSLPVAVNTGDGGNDGRGILFYLGNKFRGDPPPAVRRVSVAADGRPLYAYASKPQAIRMRERFGGFQSSWNQRNGSSDAEGNKHSTKISNGSSSNSALMPMAQLYRNPSEGSAPTVVVMCSRLLRPLPPAASRLDPRIAHLLPSASSLAGGKRGSAGADVFCGGSGDPAESNGNNANGRLLCGPMPAVLLPSPLNPSPSTAPTPFYSPVRTRGAMTAAVGGGDRHHTNGMGAASPMGSGGVAVLLAAHNGPSQRRGGGGRGGAERAQRGRLTNFTSFGPSYCITEEMPYSWIGVDFGHFRVAPTAYTIGTLSPEALAVEAASGLGALPGSGVGNRRPSSAVGAHASATAGSGGPSAAAVPIGRAATSGGGGAAAASLSVAEAQQLKMPHRRSIGVGGGSNLSQKAPSQQGSTSPPATTEGSPSPQAAATTSPAAAAPPFPVAWELQGCRAGRECGGDVYDDKAWSDECRWHVLDRRDYSRASGGAHAKGAVSGGGCSDVPSSSHSLLAGSDVYPFAVSSFSVTGNGSSGLSATFAIDPEVVRRWGYFKRFRIVQTARNSAYGHALCVSGFEVYGSLVLDRR